MNSERMTDHQGTPGSRMRSAAAGEHRTGEDVAQQPLVVG
ncbi:MAG: hypothetical protein RIR70_287, partial [Pseudomonadota bacterium]